MRALVGGRDYGASQFNRATASLRQPGSSFKPFVYAAAMQAGLYRPNSIVTDRPVCIGNWCPNNYGRSFAGSMPLTVALAKSINTIPVQMSIALGQATGESHVARAARIGRLKIIETSRAMGLNSPLTDTVSLPIGAAEVTVIDMAAGYAVFANGGRRARPYAAIEIRNSHGEVIYRHDRDEPEPAQVLSTQVAQDINFMLSKVPTEGTGRRAALEGVITAGKTGTTNGYKDAWYVGYSGNLVGAVWYGNDDSSETANMTGGSLPAMTWKEIMQFAHQGLELKPIPGVAPPDPKAATVAKAQTPAAIAPQPGRAPATCRGSPSRCSPPWARCSRRSRPPPGRAAAPGRHPRGLVGARAADAPLASAPGRVDAPPPAGSTPAAVPHRRPLPKAGLLRVVHLAYVIALGAGWVSPPRIWRWPGDRCSGWSRSAPGKPGRAAAGATSTPICAPISPAACICPSAPARAWN